MKLAGRKQGIPGIKNLGILRQHHSDNTKLCVSEQAGLIYFIFYSGLLLIFVVAMALPGLLWSATKSWQFVPEDFGTQDA